MSRSVSIVVVMAAAIAWAGCSGGDESDGTGGTAGTGGTGGTGGTAGTGEPGPISFDADNALAASSGNTIAIAVAAELGGLLGTAIGALAETPTASSVDFATKADLPLTCPEGGSARLSYNQVAAGQQVTLTFMGCVGSVLSGQALDGTIVIDIEEVSGSIVGLFPSEGTATLNNLSAGSDTTITGSFKVLASFTSSIVGPLVDLSFGNQLGTDTLTITRTPASGPSQTIEFACFKIRQVISLLTGQIGGVFEPVGVARINGSQIFSLNDYASTPPNIGFIEGAATSGSANLSSGDITVATGGPMLPYCTPFGQTPAGDNSFISSYFSGAACVEVTGQDNAGNPIAYETTWDKLLNADFSPGGATCDTNTPAAPGPETCNLSGMDRLTIADAHITGDGPEPDRMLADTNFGSAPNLLCKSGTNLGFTRKIYLAFDLSDLSAAVQSATLVLTLERHVAGSTPDNGGPRPFNFYGITDDDDWDPDTLPETDAVSGITWNNAPKNRDDWQVPFEQSAAVPLLIAGYDFMLGGDYDQDQDGVDDDGTRYAFDLTDYVNERIANDADGKITILVAHRNVNGANVNTSAFFSKEHAAEECNRPFLRIQ